MSRIDSLTIFCHEACSGSKSEAKARSNAGFVERTCKLTSVNGIIDVLYTIKRSEMASYSTNEFKSGLKVMLDGDPCSILENEFVKPGKGQAFNRVRMRNLINGRVWERTFKSGESLEAADVMEYEMEYVYSDGEYWHFMKTDGSYEQLGADKAAVSEALQWLKETEQYAVTLWNDNPISVAAPNFIELEVADTDPGLKGDTAQGGTKPATLSTGAVVKVPLFINIGEVLRIDTRTAEYQGRAKS